MYFFNQKTFLKKSNKIFKIMKLSTVILMITAMQIMATGYAQTVSLNLNMDNTSIRDVFREIERQTELSFIFSDDISSLSKEVSVNMKNRDIKDILNQLFKDTDLGYQILNEKLIVVAPKVILQQITVTGTVTDESGDPLPGVNVVVQGTGTGTVTDFNGSYTLQVPNENVNLVFSFVGFLTQEIAMGNRQKIDVILSEESSQIEEVVIVGYGTMLKRDITGAITSLSASDIEQNSGGDLNVALQGKVPGLQITTTSGEPGAGANITIRGASSINGGSEPLYIIDGVPIDAGNINSIDNDATFSPISAINPNDIESIEVLKDAASAAIYGSRAANGVIIITTKGGNNLKLSAPTVTLNHTSSIVSNIRNLDVLNATQFRELYLKAQLIVSPNFAFADWTTNPYSPHYYRSTDWQEIMFKTRYQSVTDLGIRGATESFSYGISLGFRDLQPTIVYTGYKQINARGNFTYKISKMMQGRTTISYSQQDYRRVLTGSNSDFSVISMVVKSNPCYNPYDAETGEVVPLISPTRLLNPLALARDVPYNYKRDWMIVSQNFDFHIAKGLIFSILGSYETGQTEQSKYTPRQFDYTSRLDWGIFQKDFSRRLNNENYFNYIYKAKNYRFNMMAGMSVQKSISDATRLDGSDYIDSKVTSIQSAARIVNLYYTETENSMLSFFARANYSYLDRYIIAGTLRRDGSSRFGSDNRFGYFPSVSFAWRFSDEPFMKWTNKVLYDGKLRASWGMTGNQSIGNYAWQGTYIAGSVGYDDGNTLLFNSPMNSLLKWEKTIQQNIGLDLSFFGGRVNLTADGYNKTTNDLLFNLPVEYNSGFSTVPTNYGSIRNRGMEFLVETVNLANQPVKWTTSLNITFNRSKVMSLPNDEDLIVGVTVARVGEPVGVFYAHKALGIYARDEDNLYVGNNLDVRGKYRRGTSEGDVFVGGDVIWYDADNNGYIDDNDMQIIGDPNPKFVGGIGNTFSYKGFMLNVFVQFVAGNDLMNEFRRDRNSLRFARNTGQDVLRAWKNQGDVTDRPQMIYSDPKLNFRQSSMWIEDGSFIRLKDISLSYTLAPKNFYFKTAKFTLALNNMFTWSNYSGYDPEVNTSTNPFVRGIDAGAFPKSKSFNFGVNLTF